MLFFFRFAMPFENVNHSHLQMVNVIWPCTHRFFRWMAWLWIRCATALNWIRYEILNWKSTVRNHFAWKSTNTCGHKNRLGSLMLNARSIDADAFFLYKNLIFSPSPNHSELNIYIKRFAEFCLCQLLCKQWKECNEKQKKIQSNTQKNLHDVRTRQLVSSIAVAQSPLIQVLVCWVCSLFFVKLTVIGARRTSNTRSCTRNVYFIHLSSLFHQENKHTATNEKRALLVLDFWMC